jgi:hypothetical protein
MGKESGLELRNRHTIKHSIGIHRLGRADEGKTELGGTFGHDRVGGAVETLEIGHLHLKMVLENTGEKLSESPKSNDTNPLRRQCIIRS